MLLLQALTRSLPGATTSSAEREQVCTVMNNLLKTISESQFRTFLPDADLKLLLSSVSNIRSQDAKAADSFYASLESVLLELRTVTPDSRDAEAFLKPVSRSDYPDYYEVIKQPMDLGTMLKLVKARKYKTKQEFADDLNLIWKNCFKYNSGPEHVLRGCATRLRRKAEHLLAHVSDRPDNITINGLPTPSASSSSIGSFYEPSFKSSMLNGAVNGTLCSRGHISSPEPTTPHIDLTPNTPGPSYSKSPHSASGQSSVIKHSPPLYHGSIPFENQPALVRTPSAMNLFRELDEEMMSVLEPTFSEDGDMAFTSGHTDKGKGKEFLAGKLHSIIDSDVETVEEPSGEKDAPEDSLSERNLKRKRFPVADDNRKRLRLMEYTGLSNESSTTAELLDLWWNAVDKQDLLMGGLPPLPTFATLESKSRRETRHSLTAEHPHKKDRRKKKNKLDECNNSLLNLMNRNISTLFRIRRTHSKFLILNATADPNNQAATISVEPPSDLGVDEEPILHELGWKIKGEVDQQSADDCLRWMIAKILQHAGFQGSATSALNVLMSVASEYLQNVGRTIRFLCDRYSHTMSAEEIILHTLFEGGISEIQDLERYVKDDIIRYGVRLTELEKKLVGAYREVTSVDEPNYEDMLEAEEEADMFLSGGLSDVLGGAEDFLGLRELGIEAEFGLKSLSVPKRLWKGKGAEDRASADRNHPGVPSLPYPPPPPFVPLEASKVDSQIGLLKDYYQSRFVNLSSPVHSLPTASSGVPMHHSLDGTFHPSTSTIISSSFSGVAPSLILPDDPPNPTRAKLGPLGQIIPGSAATTASKKKGKGKEVTSESRAETEAMAKKESKKKKPTQDSVEEAVESNFAIAEVNGTGPKKKSKSAGGKKPMNGSGKPSLDAPPAILASA